MDDPAHATTGVPVDRAAVDGDIGQLTAYRRARDEIRARIEIELLQAWA